MRIDPLIPPPVSLSYCPSGSLEAVSYIKKDDFQLVWDGLSNSSEIFPEKICQLSLFEKVNYRILANFSENGGYLLKRVDRLTNTLKLHRLCILPEIALRVAHTCQVFWELLSDPNGQILMP